MGIQTDDLADSQGAPRTVGAGRQSPQEEALERALRPRRLSDYVGQAKTREQLEIFIGAAKQRGDREGSLHGETNPTDSGWRDRTTPLRPGRDGPVLGRAGNTDNH